MEPIDEKCLRCSDVTLEALPAHADIRFFRCPRCAREYARREGAGLTGRWLSPISLVLYPIIFSSRPQEEAARVVELFLDGRTVAKTREDFREIVDEIRGELAQPTQVIREILPLAFGEEVVGEDDVREFLRRFANGLEAAL